MKSKEEISEALLQHLPPAERKGELSTEIASPAPSQDELTKEGEEDYRFARDRIKKLIDTSDEAIAKMHDLATDAEHPRAFEVLGGLIKQAAEMNNQLLDLQKQRRNLLQGDSPKRDSGSVNNTSIFVGTTADLQKFLKSRQKEPVIDV